MTDGQPAPWDRAIEIAEWIKTQPDGEAVQNCRVLLQYVFTTFGAWSYLRDVHSLLHADEPYVEDAKGFLHFALREMAKAIGPTDAAWFYARYPDEWPPAGERSTP